MIHLLKAAAFPLQDYFQPQKVKIGFSGLEICRKLLLWCSFVLLERGFCYKSINRWHFKEERDRNFICVDIFYMLLSWLIVVIFCYTVLLIQLSADSVTSPKSCN